MGCLGLQAKLRKPHIYFLGRRNFSSQSTCVKRLANRNYAMLWFPLAHCIFVKSLYVCLGSGMPLRWTFPLEEENLWMWATFKSLRAPALTEMLWTVINEPFTMVSHNSRSLLSKVKAVGRQPQVLSYRLMIFGIMIFQPLRQCSSAVVHSNSLISGPWKLVLILAERITSLVLMMAPFNYSSDWPTTRNKRPKT